MEWINDYLEDKFGIRVEKSAINTYEGAGWKEFCGSRGFGEAEGIYLPRDYSAHVVKDESFEQNVFHEYFGHGLFVEHAATGKALHDLEQKLMEEEKKNVKDLNELAAFRQSSGTYQKLIGLHDSNLAMYEGFAMWMEFYLSSLTKSQKGFEKKYRNMPEQNKALCQRFIDFEISYGEHALLYSCGLPKHYNHEILEGTIRKIFKEEIEFAVLYGSRKPYSDIDIFMVSENPCTCLGWLDVYSVDRKTFEDLTGKLDISITEALFTGEFIFGNKDYFESIKTRIINQRITEESISFHNEHSKKAKQLAERFSKDSQEYQSAMGYHRTYKENAKKLSEGIKPLKIKH